MISLSLRELEFEKSEVQKDIYAFRKSFDTIRKRLFEISESKLARFSSMERWSGTWASMGSLELSISVLEKKLLEIDEHIMKIQTGEIQNSDNSKKAFSIIDGGLNE